jgi:hypothetical protein
VTSSDDYLTIITSSGIAVTSCHDYPLTLAVVGVEKYITIGSKSGQTVHRKLSSSLALTAGSFRVVCVQKFGIKTLLIQ